jgi:hypothetical protein
MITIGGHAEYILLLYLKKSIYRGFAKEANVFNIVAIMQICICKYAILQDYLGGCLIRLKNKRALIT